MNLIAMVREADWCIGFGDGQLVTRLAPDARRFRELTMGGLVVMGRRTYESLPRRPLVGRVNLVVSGSADFTADGASVVMARTLEEAVVLAMRHELRGRTPWLAGGESLYRGLLDSCERALITKVAGAPKKGEVDPKYMVNLDECPDWELVEEGEPQSWRGVRYRYVEYRRLGVERGE